MEWNEWNTHSDIICYRDRCYGFIIAKNLPEQQLNPMLRCSLQFLYFHFGTHALTIRTAIVNQLLLFPQGFPQVSKTRYRAAGFVLTAMILLEAYDRQCFPNYKIPGTEALMEGDINIESTIFRNIRLPKAGDGGGLQLQLRTVSLSTEVEALGFRTLSISRDFLREYRRFGTMELLLWSVFQIYILRSWEYHPLLERRRRSPCIIAKLDESGEVDDFIG